MTEIVWLDDVPASEQGLPACGHDPNRHFPTGCTRVAGHEGPHGNPNWSARIEFRRAITGFDIGTAHSHGMSNAWIRSPEQAAAVIAAIREWADTCWPAAHQWVK